MTLDEFIDDLKERSRIQTKLYLDGCHHLEKRIGYNNQRKQYYADDLSKLTESYQRDRGELNKTIDAIRTGHRHLVLVSQYRSINGTWMRERDASYHRTSLGRYMVYLFKDPDVAFEFKMRWAGV